MALNRRRCERGSVSAELAVTLPIVIVLLGLVLGSLRLVSDQAWLTSAARWAARAISVGEDQESVLTQLTAGHVGVESVAYVKEGMICVRLTRTEVDWLKVLNMSPMGESCVPRVL